METTQKKSHNLAFIAATIAIMIVGMSAMSSNIYASEDNLSKNRRAGIQSFLNTIPDEAKEDVQLIIESDGENKKEAIRTILEEKHGITLPDFHSERRAMMEQMMEQLPEREQAEILILKEQIETGEITKKEARAQIREILEDNGIDVPNKRRMPAFNLMTEEEQVLAKSIMEELKEEFGESEIDKEIIRERFEEAGLPIPEKTLPTKQARDLGATDR